MHIAEIEHGLSISEDVGGDAVLLDGLFVVDLRASAVEVVVT